MGVNSRRHPPAVQYPVRRSHALAWLLALLLVGAAAGVAGWLLHAGRQAPAGFVLTAAGCWVLAAASSVHYWWRQPAAVLRWDGQFWTLETASRPPRSAGPPATVGAPAVLLDLQAHLWVHVQAEGRARTWLWLERSACPERWLDLRRAVYSRPKPGAGNADVTALARCHGRES